MFKHCSLLVTDSSAISMPDICQGANKNKDIKELFKKELGKARKCKRSWSMPELNLQCSSSPCDKRKETKKKQRTRKRLHSTPIFPVVDSYPLVTNNPLPITNSSIRISGSHVKITKPESKMEYVIHHRIPDPLNKVVKDAILCEIDAIGSKTASEKSTNDQVAATNVKKLQKQKALQNSLELDDNDVSSTGDSKSIEHKIADEGNRRKLRNQRLSSSDQGSSRQVSEDLDLNEVFDASDSEPKQVSSKSMANQRSSACTESVPIEKSNLYEEIPPLPPKEFRDPVPKIKMHPPADQASQNILHNSLPPPLPKRHSYTDASPFSKNHDKNNKVKQLEVQSYQRSHSIPLTSDNRLTSDTNGSNDYATRSLVKPIKDQTVE